MSNASSLSVVRKLSRIATYSLLVLASILSLELVMQLIFSNSSHQSYWFSLIPLLISICLLIVYTRVVSIESRSKFFVSSLLVAGTITTLLSLSISVGLYDIWKRADKVVIELNLNNELDHHEYFEYAREKALISNTLLGSVYAQTKVEGSVIGNRIVDDISDDDQFTIDTYKAILIKDCMYRYSIPESDGCGMYGLRHYKEIEERNSDTSLFYSQQDIVAMQDAERALEMRTEDWFGFIETYFILASDGLKFMSSS